MIAQEKMAEPIPAAKAMVTTRPDVVRVSFFFMQLFAPAVGEKQRSPGAQDVIAVTVGVQVTVVPACIEHADVDFVLVTMQTSVPVADAAVVVVLSVLEVLVVLSVVVVEEGDVVVEEAAADAEVESEVVVAAAVEGSLVVVASVVFAVVSPVVLAVVFALVEDPDSVVSALFFKSSLSSVPVSSLQLRANHTAPTVAPASEQPPVIKHFSISSNRSRSTFAPRHSEIDLEHPQVVLETSSSMSFCAHFVPVEETIAAVANSARKERIMACETSGIK